MARQSRTFKLRLSPAGMDLLIDSHCYLIRSTRSLLAWGTTLHVAIDCLQSVPAEILLHELARIPATGLSGSEEHHLGAPRALSKIVSSIAERISLVGPGREQPVIAHIYIIALQNLTRIDGAALRIAYERTRKRAATDSDTVLP